MTRKFDIAVVGATGAVGESMLEILTQRDFPVATVHALASERSIGKTVTYRNRDLAVDNESTNRAVLGRWFCIRRVCAEGRCRWLRGHR